MVNYKCLFDIAMQIICSSISIPCTAGEALEESSTLKYLMINEGFPYDPNYASEEEMALQRTQCYQSLQRMKKLATLPFSARLFVPEENRFWEAMRQNKTLNRRLQVKDRGSIIFLSNETD